MQPQTMNDASRWRLELAQRVSPIYANHPNTIAVTLGGSVARGWADRYSDIDLSIVCSILPTAAERVALMEQAGGIPEGNGDAYYICGDPSHGVRIDVGYTTQASIEQRLTDLQQQPDTIRTKQTLFANLPHVLSLHGTVLVEQWRINVASYPDGLVRTMVAHNMQFGPLWALEQLVEQGDLLAFRDSLCAGCYRLVRVLMGLNRVYDPGAKALNRHLSALPLTPRELWSRIQQVMCGEPSISMSVLQDLVLETLALVDMLLPHMDTAAMRAKFLASPSARTIQPTDHAKPVVRDHLDFGPCWWWYTLAQREDWLFLTTWLIAELHALINVLAGLNQVTLPVYQWAHWRSSAIGLQQFCADLTIAPSDLAARCTSVLQAATPDALNLLAALIEETLSIVEIHASAIDTTAIRMRYLQPRRPWDQPPPGC